MLSIPINRIYSHSKTFKIVTMVGMVMALFLTGCRTVTAAKKSDKENNAMQIASPKIVSLNTVDASSPETVIASIIHPNMTPEEKAIAIWRYCWENTWHWPPPKEDGRRSHEMDVVFDAVKQLNVYGYTYCFAIRSLAEALYEAAGLEARSGGIGGHVIPEVYYHGQYHYLDNDQRGFSRLPDGTIASVADYRCRPALILAPTGPSKPFFPAGKRPLVPYENPQIFAGYLLNQQVHYSQHNKYRSTHSMNIGLRPGERFVRSWQNVGKWHWIPELSAGWKNDGYGDMWQGPADLYADLFTEAARGEDGKPLTYGNGLLIYRPDLSAGARDFSEGVNAAVNIYSGGDGFTPFETGQMATAMFRVRLPYVIVGWPGDIATTNANITGAAVVSGRYRRQTAGDKIAVQISTNEGSDWQTVWQADTIGENDFVVDISRFVEGRYGYLVRFNLEAASEPTHAAILALGIDTACQLNPAVLPAVRAGTNKMKFSFNSGAEVFDETIQYGEPCIEAHNRLLRQLDDLKIEPGGYPSLAPVEVGKAGSVVYEMAAAPGRKIAWANVGGAFRAYSKKLDPNDRYRIYYAINKPDNWKLLYEADPAPYLSHWCFESNDKIALKTPVERIFVKFELVSSDNGGGRMVGARLVWGCDGASGKATPDIKVEHAFTVDGKVRKIARIVNSVKDSYTFQVPENKVLNNYVSLEWADRPPCTSGPHPLMTTPPQVTPKPMVEQKQIEAMRAALTRLAEKPDVATALDMLEKNPHPWVGNMGVAALIALGGPEARAALQKLAEQGHQWGEKGLQELLLREGPTSELVRQLNDGENGQRSLIADLLALRGDATAVPALKSVVDREQNPEVLSSGIAALVKLEGAAVIPQALAAIERCSYVGQLKIAAALACIDADEGFEWLVEGLRSDNRFRRYACANALAQSKHSAAEKGLLIALSDQSHWVRQAAIGGLAHCGSRKALVPLGKAARNDSQEYLRIEAAWAIENILQRDKNGEPDPMVN